MTVLESYEFVQNRLNRQGSNYGDNIPKHVFVEAFNAAQYHWCEDRIKLTETNIIRMDETQQLLTNVNVNSTNEGPNYFEFDLPSNYMHFKRAVGLAPCDMTIWLKKEGDINRLLTDEFWKPSYEWGETIGTLIGNKFRVYVDNFKITQINLVYYRVPVQINMDNGFTDVNGQPNTNIDPEFKGSSLLEILNLTAQILSGDNSDQLNYQISTGRNQQHT